MHSVGVAGRVRQLSQQEMLPFEFTVPGLPVSHQTRNKVKLRAWRATVRAAAEAAWPSSEAPTTDDVRLLVVCYYDSVPPDVDNFHKPIQDELEGLVYVNDSQVTDASSAKRDINGRYEIRRIAPVLARAFEVGHEFVHVKVDLPPDQGVLLR
jgi:crossover junction endodeoxyribonuclease RusA